MLAILPFLSVLTLSGARDFTPPPAVPHYRPRVEVWTDRGDDPYTGGQAVRVHFRTELDAYVTILRVDTDGRVRVLFPREPWEDNFARGGRDYEVFGGFSHQAFYVDDDPGVGYVFGVAAADPFGYRAIAAGDHWDYRIIAGGRVRGDPYVALTDLAERIVPDGYTDWDYDIVPYYVGRHYDYPRFLCYDCHSYASYPFWSPYDHSCIRFRIVVFDDPYYYPYRYYGGTRVVFTRPLKPEPRFIFKDRRGSDAFITRVKQRPVNDDRRREVGVRGRDLGGTGVIPPPIVKPRERPDDRQPPRDDDRGRDGARRRPDNSDPPHGPGRPENPQKPDRTEHPERVDRPDRADGRERPTRPEHARPQPPPVVQPERPRAEPRREPESRPRVEAPPKPRSEPRVEPPPKRAAPPDKPAREPELKRRKP
ncbi:MAG TPA: DUF4384 domain-containing protein [Gemmatimonadales bacterium]|nr:DUF4384 domain-containing protein [Gemmatimonadales bacterium]